MSFGETYYSKYIPEPSLVSLVQKSAKFNGKVKYVDAPYILATEKSLHGYADLVKDTDCTAPIQILQWPAPGKRAVQGGTSGGVIGGQFAAKWTSDDKCVAINEAVSCTYDRGWREKGDIFAQDANYHPDSAQAFYSQDEQPYILLLSKHHEDATVLPTSFVAFYCDGKQAVMVKPYVWHQAVFPFRDSVILKSRQGKAHGIVQTDFFREFGVYVRIPNAFQQPKSDEVPPLPIVPSQDRLNKNDILNSKTVSSYPETLKLQESTTCETFQEYGTIIPVDGIPEESKIPRERWPIRVREMHRGNEAGIATCRFSVDWENDSKADLKELLVVQDGRWKPAGCTLSDSTYQIEKMKVRLDGANLIIPRDSASFIIVVAKSDNSGEPIPETLKAFVIEPDKCILLKAKIWYSTPIPFKGCEQMALLEKYCAINAYMELDFVEEGVKPIKITVDGTLKK